MSSKPKFASNEPQASAGFSIVRVLTLVVGIAILGGVGYFVSELIQKPPALVPFTGRVIFQGKPLTVGGLATIRIGDSLDGATASFDSDGRFTLQTDGKPGALVGKHKVVISANTPTMPPSPLVPAAYSSMQTTPLTIEVSDDPTKNSVEWTLEGTISEPPSLGNAPPESPPGDTAAKDTAEPSSEGKQEPIPTPTEEKK
jgi:hypothetical protein